MVCNAVQCKGGGGVGQLTKNKGQLDTISEGNKAE